ncbi:cytochrome c oxidase subunit 4 [Nocardioides sp. ChNu-99]|uniref:cytochrome c oxidase subunit 4 n=1 Tax=unclassified Nocardioides TaxID=2615069 RepID=UPI0032177F28
MKALRAEVWIFAICTIFLILVSPAYWFVTDASGEGGDWTGTSALVMTTLLAAMVTWYLGFQARKLDERPEDRKDAEIVEGAGELGFFPPYSWWPLWAASTFGVCVLGVIFGWWLFIIGCALGILALSGWVFEYYRGVHAH